MTRKRLNLPQNTLFRSKGQNLYQYGYMLTTELLVNGASNIAQAHGAHPVLPVTSMTLSILKSAWWKPAHAQHPFTVECLMQQGAALVTARPCLPAQQARGILARCSHAGR